MMEITTSSTEATLNLGTRIGRAAENGTIVVLSGPLGAGKTVIAKGIALGLGVEEPVTSPSFAIVSEYGGRLLMRHIDLYRTGSDEELELLGFRELTSGEAVSVIEWGEKAEGLLEPGHLSIHISIENETDRRIRIEGPAQLTEQLV